MKILFILLTALLSIRSQAQQNPNVKLYAYSQQVVPGTQKAAERDENGNRLPADNGTMYNYMLYAVSASPARVYPVELWLHGKKYGVTIKTISQTPVVHTEFTNPSHPNKKVLVPQTNRKVLQLIPADAAMTKAYPKAERLAASNELVFVYKQNGKFFYQTMSRLTDLATVNLQ